LRSEGFDSLVTRLLGHRYGTGWGGGAGGVGGELTTLSQIGVGELTLSQIGDLAMSLGMVGSLGGGGAVEGKGGRVVVYDVGSERWEMLTRALRRVGEEVGGGGGGGGDGWASGLDPQVLVFSWVKYISNEGAYLFNKFSSYIYLSMYVLNNFRKFSQTLVN
jgi:hypothetical protein